MPHELFLTRRHKTKIRNAFANKMSTYVKLIKAQLTEIIQSDEFLGETLGNVIGNLGHYWSLLLLNVSFAPSNGSI